MTVAYSHTYHVAKKLGLPPGAVAEYYSTLNAQQDQRCVTAPVSRNLVGIDSGSFWSNALFHFLTHRITLVVLNDRRECFATRLLYRHIR